MKRFIQLVAILAASACARTTHVAVQPDVDEPLEVSILPPTTGYGFWVNQPAYVAMFDIVPGQGVNLLYPQASVDLARTVRAGSSWAHSTFSFRSRTYFANSLLDQAHFILAIASRQPLNISRTIGYSDWLTYKLGMSAFAGTSLEVVNQVFDEVVPVQPDGDWATAIYVVYPNVPWRNNIYQLIRCGDGFVYIVNVNLPVFQCPAAQPNAPQPPGGDNIISPRTKPEKTLSGGGIARAIQGKDLSILREVTDVVYRPPSPTEYRGRQLSGSGTGRELNGDYRRQYPESNSNQTYVTPQPGTQSTSTSAGRPATIDSPQPQAQGGQAQSPTSDRGAKSNKEP